MCSSCGHERHIFVARPQGPVERWELGHQDNRA
jgi:hypothetical protein